jgi:hypothetical protein
MTTITTKEQFDWWLEANSEGLYDEHAKLMRSKIEQYPHLAIAPTAIRPEHWSGSPYHFCRIRLRAGWQLWMWEDVRGRDLFVASGAGKEY